MKALVIPFNAPPIVVDLPDSGRLEALQQYVGGYIQAPPCPPGITMYINEDGKGQNLPPNELATKIIGDLIAPTDYIAGNAVIVGAPDSSGEDTPAPHELIDLYIPDENEPDDAPTPEEATRDTVRLDYHKHPVTGVRTYTLTIPEGELFTTPTINLDRLMLEECEASGSIADKLLGLQMIVYRIEQEHERRRAVADDDCGCGQ